VKAKYFNKRQKRRTKANLKKFRSNKLMFLKRMGGVIGVSVLLENRNTKASDFSNNQKEII